MGWGVIHCDGCPSYDYDGPEAREKEEYRRKQEEKINRSLQALRTGHDELSQAYQRAHRKP